MNMKQWLKMLGSIAEALFIVFVLIFVFGAILTGVSAVAYVFARWIFYL